MYSGLFSANSSPALQNFAGMEMVLGREAQCQRAGAPDGSKGTTGQPTVAPAQMSGGNYRIIESPKWEETFQIIQSNCPSSIATVPLSHQTTSPAPSPDAF